MKYMEINFPKKLRELMEIEGWTEHEVARIAGVSYKTVWSWLTGKSEPRLRPIIRIWARSHQSRGYWIDPSSH